MSAPKAPRRPRGIALLMSLAVVLLLTAYISESFFSTGLELRALETFKEAGQARNLAMLALRTVEIGLLKDELDFMEGYQLLARRMQFTAIPWRGGFLVQLEVSPLDSLYNLNQLHNLREGETQDKVRTQLFYSVLQDISLSNGDLLREQEPLSRDIIQPIYAALFDWIDAGEFTYIVDPAYPGAEQDAYFNLNPEVKIRNGLLNRLTEIRLVRGVVESGISWSQWEAYFSEPLPPKPGVFYPEKLNVNLASHTEIVDFLKMRKFDDPKIVGTDFQDVQTDLNNYADKAEDIALVLVPEEEQRPKFPPQTLNSVLSTVPGINPKIANQVFSTFNQFYRVRITTEMNDVEARLEVVLHVPRNPNRTGKRVEVLQFRME